MLRLIIWLILIGLVLYAVFWAIDRRAAQQPRQQPRPRRRTPPGPRGPDDDEEFLRDLDRKWRRRRDDPPG
ncbi:MAG TPA: hypothetical protein VFL69_06500 [Marmoricola sp.]|nr:hypothetical protein [Marmoricola sp.]